MSCRCITGGLPLEKCGEGGAKGRDQGLITGKKVMFTVLEGSPKERCVW